MDNTYYIACFFIGIFFSLLIMNSLVKSIYKKLKKEMNVIQDEMINTLKRQANELVMSNEFTKKKLEDDKKMIKELNLMLKEVYESFTELESDISNLGDLVINRKELEAEITKLKKILKRTQNERK